MMTFPGSEGTRGKLLIATVLGLLAVGLLVADRSLEAQVEPAAPDLATAREDMPAIDRIVDTLVVHSGINLRNVRTWSVYGPGKTVVRRESRIEVPSTFVSLLFNHQLSREISRFDARVIATERTREQVVTMHIRKNGIVVRTLTFDANPTR